MHHAEASEAITPQSQKSTGDKLSEGATDMTDKVSRYVEAHSQVLDRMILMYSSSVQPEGDKSATQSLGDSVSGEKDKQAHGGTGGGILDKAKDTLGMKK